MQFDWKVLGLKIREYPPGTKASEILSDITAPSITAPVDVPSRSLRALLYARGVWASIVKKANAAASGADSSDEAIACQMLVSMTESGDILPMTNTAIAAVLTADLEKLAGASIISQDDAAAVLEVATSRKSWADTNEWSGVSLDQVAYAMSGSVQKDPALFPEG